MLGGIVVAVRKVLDVWDDEYGDAWARTIQYAYTHRPWPTATSPRVDNATFIRAP